MPITIASYFFGIEAPRCVKFVLTGFEVFPKNIYYIDKIPVKLNPFDFAAIIVPTVVVGMVASFAAAHRATWYRTVGIIAAYDARVRTKGRSRRPNR